MSVCEKETPVCEEEMTVCEKEMGVGEFEIGVGNFKTGVAGIFLHVGLPETLKIVNRFPSGRHDSRLRLFSLPELIGESDA
jgi:hypothetical protein